jgi:hypothetical protein
MTNLVNVDVKADNMSALVKGIINSISLGGRTPQKIDEPPREMDYPIIVDVLPKLIESKGKYDFALSPEDIIHICTHMMKVLPPLEPSSGADFWQKGFNLTLNSSIVSEEKYPADKKVESTVVVDSVDMFDKTYKVVVTLKCSYNYDSEGNVEPKILDGGFGISIEPCKAASALQ